MTRPRTLLRDAFAPMLAALATALACPGAAAQVAYKIVTASERGTYIQIGRDLASIVAPDAGIALEVLPSAGSAENVRRLRYEAGVKFALVQSDVYQAFIDQASSGNAEARQLLRPLRLILPLYNEEIYFVVRADSRLQYVHEIRDARINVGPLLSGTAMTATTLYRQLFGNASPEASTSFLSNEEALVKLTGDKSVDVVVIVGGQPTKLLADMKPEARQLVKLLRFDSTNAASKAALDTYVTATVRASSYPNLLSEDLPGLAVQAYLVTYDYDREGTRGTFARFARSLCQNFPALQTKGHPKWREVQLAQPALKAGWTYYPPTQRELTSCRAKAPAQSAPAPARPATGKPCSQQERVLGLCG
jgi:TRAP transporter TAXI family solute receptor